MKKTALFEKHQSLQAKIVDFAGWQMPIQYKGIVHEHQVVRERIGIFDVSHMGRISVEGPGAELFLDFLSTNLIKGKSNGSATYTVMCNEKGRCIDDTIIYRESNDHFFLITNASNREVDLHHLIQHGSSFNVTITDHFEDEGILAIQGKEAKDLVVKLFPEAEEIKPMHFKQVEYQGIKIILSRTGYTGAGGFEVYAPNETIVKLWDLFISHQAEPVGLGARDTLRLEMGFALYGNELSLDISPIETVAAWAVKLHEHDFLGKEAILKLKESGKVRAECGIILRDKGIARKECPVWHQGIELGFITSGTFSPTLKEAIAIAVLNQELPSGEIVEVEIRNKRVKGEVVALPFLKKKA